MTQETKVLTIGLVKQNIAILILAVPMIFWIASVDNKLALNDKNDIAIEAHFKEEEMKFEDFNKKDDDNAIKYLEIKAQLEGIKATQSDIILRLNKLAN